MQEDENFDTYRARLKAMSSNALLAFAARCGRRFSPIFRAGREGRCKNDWDIFSRALEFVEKFSSGEIIGINEEIWLTARNLNKEKILLIYSNNDPIRKTLSLVTYAARAVIESHNNQNEKLLISIDGVLDCVAVIVEGNNEVKIEVQRDISTILAIQNTHQKSVPIIQPFEFGELWPYGEPCGWPNNFIRYDAFISHASEDKDKIVRPIAEGLRHAGLKIWYDEFSLAVGDSLRQKIDAGLTKSRFGIVILSPAFFLKKWAQYELDGLIALDMKKTNLLPIWCNLDTDALLNYSPTLAMRVAIKHITVEETIDKLIEIIYQ